MSKYTPLAINAIPTVPLALRSMLVTHPQMGALFLSKSGFPDSLRAFNKEYALFDYIIL